MQRLTLLFLAAIVAVAAPEKTIRYQRVIPEQIAGTEYVGPKEVPRNASSRMLAEDSSKMGGLEVSSTGVLSGKLRADTAGRQLLFTICEIPKNGKSCADAVVKYELCINVIAAPPLLRASTAGKLATVQYIGSPYHGPDLGARVRGDQVLCQISSEKESAGISLGADGVISGKITGPAGEVTVKAGIKRNSTACEERFAFSFSVAALPEFPDDGEGLSTSTGAGAPTENKAQIRGDLVPGQKEIYVNATPSGPGETDKKTRVYPFVNGKPASLTDQQGNATPFAVTDASGQAYLQLRTPLAQDEKLEVLEIVGSKATSAPAYVEQSTAMRVATDPLDLGLVRYYFTTGIVLSNSQQFALQPSSTQAGLYLGLTADRSWLMRENRWNHVWGINTYFDARLTPVATQSTAVQTNITTAPVPALAGGASNPGQSTTTVEQFVRSQKAAILQIGAYLPYGVKNWEIFSTQYGLSVAPIAKAGFSTLTDDQRVSNGVDTGRFYTSYSFGGRFDLSQMFLNSHRCGTCAKWDNARAPRSIGYLDVTVGRFGNFAAFRDLTAEQGITAPNHEYYFARPWRYSFEGYLKIPKSVFIVGLNANIGMGAHPPDKINGVTRPYTQIRDDLRFLFGAQFDFNQLMKIIPSLQ